MDIPPSITIKRKFTFDVSIKVIGYYVGLFFLFVSELYRKWFAENPLLSSCGAFNVHTLNNFKLVLGTYVIELVSMTCSPKTKPIEMLVTIC